MNVKSKAYGGKKYWGAGVQREGLWVKEVREGAHGHSQGPGPRQLLFLYHVLKYIVFYHFLLHFSWHLGWIVLALKFGYFKFHDLMFWSPAHSCFPSLGKLCLCLSPAFWPFWRVLGQIIHSVVSDVCLFCQHVPWGGSPHFTYNCWSLGREHFLIFMLIFI